MPVSLSPREEEAVSDRLTWARVEQATMFCAVFVIFAWAMFVKKDHSVQAIIFVLCFIYYRVDDIALRERRKP